ncbi:MAG: hypothetical protein MZV49_13670 [Rhodopseudomonas palustris]|nr:hypothetical protein [Rhodopseudomonas palustris]
MACGTIPMVVYYGPEAHLPAILPGDGLSRSARLTALATGTSLGHGRHRRRGFHRHRPWRCGIPLGPAAGAIVAGAYFGRQDVAVLRHPQPGPGRHRSQPFRPHRATCCGRPCRPGWLGLAVYFVMGLRYGRGGGGRCRLGLIRLTALRDPFHLPHLAAAARC